jgi:hypothetical protein
MRRPTVVLLVPLAAILLAGVIAGACRPAENPGDACKPLPPGGHGCLDGDFLRPTGCTLAAGPVGPYSPGSNCTCVERLATGLIEWDCKKWLM